MSGAMKRPSRKRTCAVLREAVSKGWVPDELASEFSLAELRALAVLAENVVEGELSWPLARFAALALTSRDTVRRAFEIADALGLLAVIERRGDRGQVVANGYRITSTLWRQQIHENRRRCGAVRTV